LHFLYPLFTQMIRSEDITNVKELKEKKRKDNENENKRV